MFKCCVCNKSSKKEKSNGDATKSTPNHSQKAVDSSQISSIVDTTKADENGPIVREEKVNGDVQRFEKTSPPMEKNHLAEVVDDLTVKSPLPSAKREEIDDENPQSREGSPLKTTVKNEVVVDGADKADGEAKEDKSGEVSGFAARNGELDGDDNIGEGCNGGGVGGVAGAILNSGIGVKTNIYDALGYIERTVDDGPDEEGDDSVFEACPSDNDANKKPPAAVSSIPRWLSEEEDVEHDSEGCSGMQEPPATPVARDELALRRHRFFSDLLHAAQNASEHRVRLRN